MLRCLLLATIVALITACGAPRPLERPPLSEPADPAVARIDSMVAEGRLDAAAEAWMALAAERPDQAFEFRMNAIESWLRDGQAEPARAALAETVAGPADELGDLRLDLARAELALLDGDLTAAAWYLARAGSVEQGPLADRYQALEQSLRQRQDFPAREAFNALESAIYDGDFSPELALALLIEQPLASLDRLLLEHGHRPELLPWLELTIDARRYLLDPVGLETALANWQARHPEVGYDAEQALLWLTAWRQTRPGPAKVAVVLPGRTEMERVSAALRDGILSAWLNKPSSQRPELMFQYIGDEAEAIVSAWFEAREAGADFMLGPLERGQVDTLLALPDPGLPILMLNHPSDPALFSERSAPIHAIGLLPEEEAALVAAHALVHGHRRALILGQSGEWGQRVAGAFRTYFELGGGQIRDAAEYASDQADHSALLEVLLNLDRSEQRIRRLESVIGQPLEAEPVPRTDIDLIFLAARAEDGRQIRPQLRFFGVGDVPVMATTHVLAGAPEAPRDSDLDGIVLPLAPWFMDNTPAGQERLRAESRFQHLERPSLSRLHALGADAMSLVGWLDLMRVDPALYLAGRSGRLSLGDGRRISRDLPFVRLADGRAIPVR
ncbi:MAG: penicillin-binding protein activator [Wenzhouxiangella sp.]|jgi:outer membrane PBP1 activator LpoA protein|nr:penicillin-binding protein activator [Wenzhouxiangella sp.]